MHYQQEESGDVRGDGPRLKFDIDGTKKSPNVHVDHEFFGYEAGLFDLALKSRDLRSQTSSLDVTTASSLRNHAETPSEARRHLLAHLFHSCQ